MSGGDRFAVPSLADDRWQLAIIRHQRLVTAHEQVTAALAELADLAWGDMPSEHPPLTEADCDIAEALVAALRTALDAYKQAVQP